MRAADGEGCARHRLRARQGESFIAICQPGNILLDGKQRADGERLRPRQNGLDQNSDLTRTLETLGTPGYISAPGKPNAQPISFSCAGRHLRAGRDSVLPPHGPTAFVGANVLVVIIKLLPLPRRVCVHSLRPSTATWRQSSLVFGERS